MCFVASVRSSPPLACISCAGVPSPCFSRLAPTCCRGNHSHQHVQFSGLCLRCFHRCWSASSIFWWCSSSSAPTIPPNSPPSPTTGAALGAVSSLSVARRRKTALLVAVLLAISVLLVDRKAADLVSG